jgi:hypothetical protein
MKNSILFVCFLVSVYACSNDSVFLSEEPLQARRSSCKAEAVIGGSCQISCGPEDGTANCKGGLFRAKCFCEKSLDQGKDKNSFFVDLHDGSFISISMLNEALQAIRSSHFKDTDAKKRLLALSMSFLNAMENENASLAIQYSNEIDAWYEKMSEHDQGVMKRIGKRLNDSVPSIEHSKPSDSGITQ